MSWPLLPARLLFPCKKRGVPWCALKDPSSGCGGGLRIAEKKVGFSGDEDIHSRRRLKVSVNPPHNNEAQSTVPMQALRLKASREGNLAFKTDVAKEIGIPGISSIPEDWEMPDSP